MIKNDPSTSIKKHANELKVLEKTERKANKQDLSPDLSLLDYNRWGVFENKKKKCNFPWKSTFDDEWNKMSEWFIVKTCKSFWRCVDTIILKNGGHIE